MSEPAGPDVLVIGYGNELRGDDAIGPRIAAEVQARGWPGVQALAVHQLTPELAETLARVRVVIFADARVGPADDEVKLIRVASGAHGPPLTHSGSPASLVALARAIYDHVPEAWAMTIAGESFTLGEPLSAPAQRRIRAAVERIEFLLRGQGDRGERCMN